MSGTACTLASVACVYGPMPTYIVTLMTEHGQYTLSVTGNDVSFYEGGPYLHTARRFKIECAALSIVDALRNARLVNEMEQAS